MSNLNNDMDRLDKKINKLATPKKRKGTWGDETGTHHAAKYRAKNINGITYPVRGLLPEPKRPIEPMGLKEKARWKQASAKRTQVRNKHNKALRKSARRVLKKNWKIIWG